MRALAQTIDEPARRSATAGMLVQRRQGGNEPIAKAGYVDGRELLERAKPYITSDDGRQPPKVGSPQSTNASDAKG